MREEVRRLILQAERDLESAAKNIGVEAFEVASFLCQQAVEKMLKAAWSHVRNEPPPYGHNLLVLARPLGMPPDLGPRLFYLNLDYTVSRYPDAANGIPYEQYDLAIAQDKLATAEAAFAWLRPLVAAP